MEQFAGLEVVQGLSCGCTTLPPEQIRPPLFCQLPRVVQDALAQRGGVAGTVQ